MILINSELYCTGVAGSRGADAPTHGTGTVKHTETCVLRLHRGAADVLEHVHARGRRFHVSHLPEHSAPLRKLPRIDGHVDTARYC